MKTIIGKYYSFFESSSNYEKDLLTKSSPDSKKVWFNSLFKAIGVFLNS